MSKLAQLKKSRGANLKRLQEKIEKEQSGSGGGYQRDERIWKPKFNKQKGKGTAIVRLLQPQEGDAYFQIDRYDINGPGGKYFGVSRDTVGEDDPIKSCYIDMFKRAKATGDEGLKKQAHKYRPKSQFYTNVLVIKDEENPENEGKVMIWQYGWHFQKMILAKLKPEFDDIEPHDIFDYWGGSNLIIRMVKGSMPDSKTGETIVVPDYKSSEWAQPDELFDGDDQKIEEIYTQTHNLSTLLDITKDIQSYDEVAKRFLKVTGKPHDHWREKTLEEQVNETIEQQQRQMASEQQSEQKEEPEENNNDNGSFDEESDDGEFDVEGFISSLK